MYFIFSCRGEEKLISNVRVFTEHVRVYMQIHIYIHIHTYTYIYTYTHIYIYIYICINICMIYLQTYTYILMYTYITYTYVCRWIYTHTYWCVYIHIYIHAYHFFFIFRWRGRDVCAVYWFCKCGQCSRFTTEYAQLVYVAHTEVCEMSQFCCIFCWHFIVICQFASTCRNLRHCSRRTRTGRVSHFGIYSTFQSFMTPLNWLWLRQFRFECLGV